MDYVRAFHRYNLVQRGEYRADAGRRRWLEIETDLLAEFDTLVLLGAEVKRAMGIDKSLLTITPSLVILPHPSGRNLWYNNPMNRLIVEIIMEELYTEAACGYNHVSSGEPS